MVTYSIYSSYLGFPSIPKDCTLYEETLKMCFFIDSAKNEQRRSYGKIGYGELIKQNKLIGNGIQIIKPLKCCRLLFLLSPIIFATA